MKKYRNWLNVLGLIIISLVYFHGPNYPVIADYSRSTTIDYTTDKIGKNSASIGAIKKLDVDLTYAYTYLTYLQSNYYGTTEPESPVAGQIWYDATAGYLKVYSGASWGAVAAAAGISNLVEDTTPELGGSLDTNQFSISFDPTPTSDHTWNGIIETQTVNAGAGVVIGDVCVLDSGGTITKADADSEGGTKGKLLMATATIAAGDPGVFLVKGYIRDDTWNWAAPGEELFVSATAGNPTETKPATTGQIQRIIGWAQSVDIVYFDPSGAYVEVP